MPTTNSVSVQPFSLLKVSGIKGRKVNILANRSTESITDLIKSIVSSKSDNKQPFYILDLGVVVELFHNWNTSLPNIQPFYAVKCNTEPALLGTLANLGAGFDCASRTEIEAALATGVRPDCIIYANTCKPEPHIKYAAENGVNLTTFDSIYEIGKIKRHHPKCSLLLRIKPPDETGARLKLGAKFGALPEEVSSLLLAARSANLNVIGVSFHIGSGATNFATYRSAIAAARATFDSADKLGGLGMYILNIGGGFTAGPQFDEAVYVIKSSIGDYFSDKKELVVMAEPGRFFAESAFTLTTNIIGKRVRGELREYWIDDGIHGSMSCIKKAGATVSLVPLVDEGKEEKYTSTVFGPTCDAGDMVLKEQKLPELDVGDSLVSHNMGAYAASMGSNFNGFFTSAIQTQLAYSYSSSIYEFDNKVFT